ncbi:glycoside hydrolase family 5 protein [Mrakia frigida]|uniref:glycoside hydrolase family 5 protein n=1 Tax=Mrakia frigida TaxID=29902 RepID=UPI003FCC07CC
MSSQQEGYTTLPQLSTRGRHFVDPQGRVVWLRGANVGAASKVPAPSDPHIPLHDHREVSYVNRPFPLDEAHDHLARLESWGFNFLRITVTWEALEHSGPGIYDEDYLTYLHSLLFLLPKYSIRCFVVIHQDVFSRLSGGSGAPGWTLELAGFDVSDDGASLEATGSAYLGGVRQWPEEHVDRGRWPTGYQKLVCATMNTLFWAGDELADKIKVKRGKEEVGIQTFLQDAFLAAFGVLVDKVGTLESVIGFELLNEPHPGYLALPSLHSFNYNTDLHLHLAPSALQSFALGAGHTQTIPLYTRSWPFPTRTTKSVEVNVEKKKVWRDDGPTGGKCIWEVQGVWGWDEKKRGGKGEAVALRETYFTKGTDGREINFYEDAYFPFIQKWSTMVNSKLGKDKFLFVEAIPNEWCPDWPENARPENMILAPHWYDLNALFTKGFGFMTINVQGLARGKFLPLCLYFGDSGAKKNYAHQLKNVLDSGYKILGERPQILGELGVPMDLNDKHSFRTSDFSWSSKMMDALISGLESNLVGFTLWNYNPGNSDEHGDGWNGENFSWFSQERAKEERAAEPTLKEGDVGWYEKGARLLDVIVRPYPIALAGIPVSSTFVASTSSYTLRYAIPPAALPGQPLALTSKTTEIFLPTRLYGHRYPLKEITVACSEGKIAFIDPVAQILIHEGEERTNEWREGTIEIFIKKSQFRLKVEKVGAAMLIGLLALFVRWFGYEEILSWPERLLLWFVGLFID